MARYQHNRRDKWLSPKKTQVILGFIFAFMAVMLLALGIVRIWTWFNANFAHRELAYQRSRLKAGKPLDYQDTPGPAMFKTYPDSRTRPEWMRWVKKQTIIDISGEDTGEQTGDPDKRYKPIDLTEEWVFEGVVREGVSLYGTAAMTPEEIEKQCEERCESDEDCITFYLDEPMLERTCSCFVYCMCELATAPEAAFQLGQAQRLRDQASRLRASASSMRAVAEDCDDPWEICWWGDWGSTPGELRNAAAELDAQAAAMDAEALAFEANAAIMMGCCEEETYALQQACVNEVVADSECDRYCSVECSYQCDYFSGKRGRYENCHSGCDGHCYNICTQAVGSDCEDLTNNQITIINNLIAELVAEREKIQSGIDSISARASECDSWSNTYCDDKCTQQGGNYDDCYDACYSEQSQDCCESVCCKESGNQITCYNSRRSLISSCDEALQASCTADANEICTEEGEPRDDVCFGEEFAECYNDEALVSAGCYEDEGFVFDSWMGVGYGFMGYGTLGTPCSAYGRDCDYDPTDVCDEKCYTASEYCPRCGLPKIITQLEERIAEINAEIDDLNTRIEDLGDCCTVDYPVLESQMDCIKTIMTRE